MQFELSCMGRRPLIKLFYYEQLTTAVKWYFLSLHFATVFHLLMSRDFSTTLSLRLIAFGRKQEGKIIKRGRKLAIATKYKLGVLSLKMADLFKWGISNKAINIRVL